MTRYPQFKNIIIILALTIFLTAGCSLGQSTSSGPETSRSSGSATGAASVSPAATSANSAAGTTVGNTTVTAGSSAVPSITPKPTTGTTKASAATTKATTTPSPTTGASASVYAVTLRRDLLILMTAYPDALTDVESKDGQVWLLTKSGGRLLYDDRKTKSFDSKLSGADLQDMLELVYPLRRVTTLMPTNMDPGRFRCYPLLNALYGNSESARYAHLVRVPFGTQNLLFSTVASASAQLAKASAEVAALVRSQPAVGDDAYPSSGTWNSRYIAGTTNLSAHAYGIAIDLHAHAGDYWTSASTAAGAARLSGYPADLTQIFENQGFIWGGKWNHFDIMHYEYRPEILLKARWFTSSIDLSAPWYQGADTSSTHVRTAIALIDSRLK